MLKRVFVFLGILILLSVSTFAAGAPRLINFQGKLTNAVGSPETGSHDLTFKIYDAGTGGTKLWEETVSGVMLDSAGQFSTILGSTNNLNIDFSKSLWLQVEYGGQIFTPRQRLSSVPYALYAITAESLAGGITQEIINLTINNNLTVSGTGDSTFTGSVGIGTTDATSKLTVAGTVEMKGFKMTPGTNGYVLTSNPSGVGTWQAPTGGVGGGGWTKAGTVVSLTTGTDNVGIGTTEVEWSAKLQVADKVNIMHGTNPNLLIGDSGSEYTQLLWNSSGNYAQLYTPSTYNIALMPGGSVGIGTTNPGANKLKVSGTAEVTGTLKIGAYTLPNTNGADGQVLKMESPGVVTWSNDLTGGGGGDIYGSGVSGYVAKFTNGNTIGDSTITDNGTTVSMTGNLTVNGAGTNTITGYSNFDSNTLYVNAGTDRVGIGTSGPQNKLDVEGGAVIGATYSGTNAAPTNGLLVEGNVGIGTTNPGTNRLKVDGTAEVTGFKMSPGAQDTYVLTSNAGGVGTWKPAAGGITHEVDNLTVNNYLTVSGEVTITSTLEVDNDTLYVNAATHSVGIGTTDVGTNKLKVQGTAEVTGDLTVSGTGNSSFAGRVLIGLTAGDIPPDAPATLKLAVSGDVFSFGEIGANNDIHAGGDIKAEGILGANGTGESSVGGSFYVAGDLGTNGSLWANDMISLSNGKGRILNNGYLGCTAIDDSGGAHFGGSIDVAGESASFNDVYVRGWLNKPAGSFLIDHPLDPKNKVLRHSFVESPEMRNIYEGTVLMGENGEAVVKLPAYFEALNKDFRCQLTCVGGYAPVYVKEEVKDNKFVIAGGTPGQKVYWMVTGTRQDAFALKNPMVVEEEKGTGTAKKYTKGEYLYQEGNK
jgi:hypothetical protein